MYVKRVIVYSLSLYPFLVYLCIIWRFLTLFTRWFGTLYAYVKHYNFLAIRFFTYLTNIYIKIVLFAINHKQNFISFTIRYLTFHFLCSR